MFPVSYERYVKEHIVSEDCCTGEAFNTVWYVEQIDHAALSMNVSMSAGSTDSAMSISEVHIIVPRT
jgi:hypothetical protein